MLAEDVFQSQQIDVRMQRHFAHAVSVKVKLVFDNLGEMLPNSHKKTNRLIYSGSRIFVESKLTRLRRLEG